MFKLESEDRTFSRFSILLFLFLLVYILLRAFINEPIHDEIATFLYYIYRGDFYGEHIVWDANNHLLNSFLGHLIYPLVKDNFGFLRIFNVLGFVLYFFAIRILLSSLSFKPSKYLGLVALNTIPFILDYFSYTRGYGMSMGFFACSLVFLQKNSEKFEVKNLFITYGFLLLALSSNLNFINTAYLVLAWFGLQQLFLGKTGGKKIHFMAFSAHLLFILSSLPFIYFGMLLKEKGALYYGSLEGIWDLTGNSLVKSVFFKTADWVMYPLALVLLVFIAYVASQMYSEKLKIVLKQPFTLYFYLFFANLAGIVVLAEVFHINYPEDRVGMNLIFLFFLMWILFSALFKSKIMAYLLLFFPLSFVWQLNFHTSVHSPDDRMTDAFYQAVKKEIEPENSIMAYHLMNLNFPLHESHQTHKSTVLNRCNINAGITDIILTKSNENKNPFLAKYYRLIASDPDSYMLAYKRKIPLIKEKIAHFEQVAQRSNAEYLNVLQYDSLDKMPSGALQFTIKGKLKSDAIKNQLDLVIATNSDSNPLVNYETYNYELNFQGQTINDDFIHHFVLENHSLEEKTVKIYFWNRSLQTLELSPITVDVYRVSNPK